MPRVRPLLRSTALCCAVWVASCAAVGGSDHCFVQESGEPRTLVLALDGVPFRVIERAREKGLFAGWPAPVPLVSTFPSLTNVAFTAMFEPTGIAPAGGYEVQRFDIQANRVVGGTPFGYKKRLYAWREVFDVTGRGFGSKVAVYTGPGKKARKEWSAAERFVLESDRRLILAHVGGTDAMIHLRGDDRILSYLEWLDGNLELLRKTHLETRGQPLRVILLSDHGNTDIKVRKLRGVRRRLRRAGFRTVRKLKRDKDVVAVTFGVVNYGALYTREENARGAAEAVVAHPGIEIAAWRSGANAAEVRSDGGAARLSWRGVGERRRLRYEPLEGDPLGLAAAVEQLQAGGELDAEDFASDESWFAHTARAVYPDALGRLADAMTGSFVANRATVLFSVTPGYAWGWVSAHVSSKLGGGRLEGTHGGLDRGSTLGFYQSSDPRLQPANALRATEALRVFHASANCRDRAGAEFIGAR